MKAILIILLVSIAYQVSGQEMKCNGGAAELQQVVVLEGKSTTDIYKLTNRWIAKNFHNKDKVIQSTIENELIRGDGYEPKTVNLGMMMTADLSYTFTVDVKDGKMRFTMTNMRSNTTHASYAVETYCCKDDGSIRSNGQSQKIKTSIEVFFKKLIDSFNASLTEKNDW